MPTAPRPIHAFQAVGLASVLVVGACSTVPDAGTIVVVTPSSVELARGDSVHLNVLVVDGDGEVITNPTILVHSADTTIVTVSATRWVRGRRLGTTSVIVEAGGARRGVPTSVHVRPSGILLVPNSILISRGDTVRITATPVDEFGIPIQSATVTWVSTQPAVASVTSTGLVRAEGSGYAQILAHFPPVSATAFVTVRGPFAVVVTPDDTTISQGDSAQFRAVVVDQVGDPVSGVTVTWESSDSTIATINASGLARALTRDGTVTIRARYNSLTREARLAVRNTTILGERVLMDGPAYGSSISATGVVYVTLPHSAQLARTDLPDRSFAGRVSVGSVPTEVSFNTAGTIAYVTNQHSHNIGVIDVAADSQVDVIPVTGDPFEIFATLPGDSVLYVATNVNQVYAIRIATKEVITQFSTGGGVGNEMVIRNDTLLYVSTHANGTVIEWNLRTRSVGRTFTVGGAAQKMAFSADKNTLYIANEAGYVTVWNLITGTQDGATIPIPGGAYGLARRPTTGMLYVTNAYFGSGDIFVVDPATRQIFQTVAAGGSTRDVVFASNGVGFVPNEGGWVDFIK